MPKVVIVTKDPHHHHDHHHDHHHHGHHHGHHHDHHHHHPHGHQHGIFGRVVTTQPAHMMVAQ